MKIIFCCLLIVSQSFALQILYQRDNPVHWAYSVKKLDQNKYELHMTASMDASWHIYAQAQPKEAIAIPTKIKFSLNPLVGTSGKLKEIGRKEKKEIKDTGIVQYEYGDAVDFVQVVSLKANVKTNISGIISYQACTDEMCLPVKTISFSLLLN